MTAFFKFCKGEVVKIAEENDNHSWGFTLMLDTTDHGLALGLSSGFFPFYSLPKGAGGGGSIPAAS